MKSFYQQHQDRKLNLDYRKGSRFTFPAHFHKNFEIFILRNGSYKVTHNGTNFLLSAGDVIFFDSYDIHMYDKPFDQNTDGLVLIVPTNMAEKFCKEKAGKKILHPVFSDIKLCEKIISLSEEFLIPTHINATVKQCACELVLSLIREKLVFSSEKVNDETTLIQNILGYINDNFKNDVTLKNLAKQFGYSQEHVSRVFHRYLNCGIPNYVNNLRLDYVEQILNSSSNAKITNLLFEAGFKSIQSYYRSKSVREIENFNRKNT